MEEYTVSELADLAGVSVRTLHYYDQIGLLDPSARTAAGYRVYREPDLFRLQQILFFKQFGIELGEIREILDEPGFEPVEALRDHRRMLEERQEQLGRLIDTIDRTISHMTEENMTLTDKELFAGFTPEQAERYRRQARERWGSEVDKTEDRLRELGPDQWRGIQEQGQEVTKRLAELVGRPADDPEVQAAIAQHHAWIEHFYPAPAERYRGLGQLYVEHDEFRAFYEGFRAGLAEFMQAAIEVYCEQTLEP